MKKWWILLTAFFCWIIAGFTLFDIRLVQNTPANITTDEISRIISTAPNITEILFALGLEEKIAAVTSDSIYPPAAAKKTKIGNFWQPDIETIIATKPNLVVTLGFPLYPQQQNLADRLRRIGYTCLTVFNNEQISDLFDAINKLGLATQTQDKAYILATQIQNEIKRISLLTTETEKIRVLYVVQREPLRVAGTDTFINEMISLAGGENAIGPTIQKYPPIGTEQLILCNADVIIEPTMGQKNSEQLRNNAVEYWSRYKNIPAVENNRIYVVDDDTISQLGPRLNEGVETIARCLRPELFEKPN
ncbi:MAG: ABC transporter substrate-binding protein [Sedimentisphaerales bacterium]|nr:ABC transporter substrate-binding protein [Sedimentisphaerales bacterium]